MIYKKINNFSFNNEDVKQMARHFEFNELTCKVLLSRGFSIYDIEQLLVDKYIEEYPFFEIPNIEQATQRIEDAMMTGEKIAVYGDYDADGICGTSIIINSFKSYGYDEVIYYIPNRISEGYGLNNEAIDYLKEQGITLIITVDCGISNVKEVDYAINLGIDVIITDHHLPSDTLPKAINVNPKLSSDDTLHLYCGAMVALKLMCVLFDEQVYYENCDIAAIATIADMVELTGENRQVVKMGLARLNVRSNKNIGCLIDECIKNKKQIKADNIAYSIAPAINAAGRLDAADKCVELFTGSSQFPQETAAILAHDNYNRRKIEKEVVASACSMIEQIDLNDNRAIILSNKNWHQGVLGIAASKIKNMYYRPVILFTENEGDLVGSARSVDGINIHEAIDYASEYVSHFGGHFMAAGLSIKKENFELLKQRIIKYLSKYDNDVFIPKTNYDVSAATDEIDLKFLSELELLEPFGKGNPAPVLYLNYISVRNYKKMGADNKHFRCDISNGENSINSVAFSNDLELFENVNYDAIVSPQKNEWNGNTSVQAIIYNIKPNYNEASWIDSVSKLDKEFKLSIVQSYYHGDCKEIKYVDYDYLIKSLDASPFSTIILATDIESAKNLKDKVGSRFDSLDIRKIKIEDGKINYNTLVIAPDFELINLEEFKNVFIITSFDVMGKYKALRSKGNVYIINDNKKKLNEFSIDIDRLRKIYIIIKNSILNGTINKAIYENEEAPYWEIRVALKIFSEVSLVEYNLEDNRYMLTDKKKTDIQQSKTFINIQAGK